MNNSFDISVVGGGIVGLASAYKLQLRFPKLKIIVLEKEKELAFHQTGRNSGVIHSGLYYKTGSFRAKNCVDGRKQLVQFAIENNIRHDVCGKIVLATNTDEAKKLVDLKENGEKNGLINLKILNLSEIKEIEPFAEGVAALWVPESGIIDYKQVANTLADLISMINPNSKVLCSCEVLDINDGFFKNIKWEYFC
jgi:L-2-hydroxyglutarate oxidase